MASPFILSHPDSLDGGDFLVKLAVFPGCFIIGGIVFLFNGCVENYADTLPRKYRSRSSQEQDWQSLYSVTEMDSVCKYLQMFSVCHGFRAIDAYQFHPDDPLLDLLGEFYPDNTYPNCLGGRIARC